MVKKNWKTLLITSLIILLPVVAGLILWNKLPEQMPTHWNAAGEVDGWSSKAFAVFGLPGMMMVFHWICVLATGADPKNANHPEKVLQLVLWIIPVITVGMMTAMYLSALGQGVRIEIIAPIMVGLLLTIAGNYLPKCKQNYTIGIKIPWTLNSEENWNRTHRFAGRLWTISGVVLMATGLLDAMWIFFGLAMVIAFTPMVYSYILYKKGI